MESEESSRNDTQEDCMSLESNSEEQQLDANEIVESGSKPSDSAVVAPPESLLAQQSQLAFNPCLAPYGMPIILPPSGQMPFYLPMAPTAPAGQENSNEVPNQNQQTPSNLAPYMQSQPAYFPHLMGLVAGQWPTMMYPYAPYSVPYPMPPPFLPTNGVHSHSFQTSSYVAKDDKKTSSNDRAAIRSNAGAGSRVPSLRQNRSNYRPHVDGSDSRKREEHNPRYAFTTCAYAGGYFTTDKKTRNWLARTKLRLLEDEFQTKVLNRQQEALKHLPSWEPRDRSKDDELDFFESDDEEQEALRDLIQVDASDTEDDCDSPNFFEDEEDAQDREEMLQLRASLKEKKRMLRQIWEEEAQARRNHRQRVLEEKVDEELLRVYNLRVRGRRQEEEVRYKMAHPRKLHPELWYNVADEFNDGPACSCREEYRVGPVHDRFEGDGPIPPCDPESNNADRLFHYRIFILPTTNFTTNSPTTIPYNGNNYEFEGFSMFTHQKIDNLPIIQILRYTCIYLMFLVEEDFPQGVTVRSMDMLTDYIFTELLELLDVSWFPSQWSPHQQNSCRVFHLLPRFVRKLDTPSNGVSAPSQSTKVTSKQGVELLPTPVILQYLLDHSGSLFNAEDLHRLHTLTPEKFAETIGDLRGSLVTKPGWKPAAIRVDQVDRVSVVSEMSSSGSGQDLIYPLLVHITVTPIKLSLRRDPQYKRVFRNLLRLEYTIYNKPRVTVQDKEKLAALASKLEALEMEKAARRQVTAEISSNGFYHTGLRTDVSQHALVFPHFMRQVRFHLSLATLEKRMNYTFKDKALIHQALTHPSYLRFTYGTNGDHVQNSMSACGQRFIEYGDRLRLFKEWRKKGLSQMIRIMSCLPNQHETRSNIYGNERLELLGDAVIEITCSAHLFFLFPDMTEGHLDAYRQALVQNQHLCLLAMRLGLHQYLLYAHGADFCLDSTFLHVRSDAFEAVMGAISLDGGLHVADRIFSAVVFSDNPRVLDVWCHLPPHPLQAQYPEGDRHWITKHPVMQKLTHLEDRLGIHFHHIRLLAKSLTVRKTGYNFFTLGNNQRLEFLGDSLMKYVATDYLFRHFPNHHEGHLSILKNSLVNKHTQAEVCVELGLEEFILKPVEATPGQVLLNNVKSKADVLEAFVGALYVDKDLKWVERFCQVCFWPRLLEFILKQEWNDGKSKLQQCCLTLSGTDEPEVARYKILRHFGPTNKRRYEVGVYFRGKLLGIGSGWSVQEAEMNAAEKAIKDHYEEFPQLEYQRRLLSSRYDDDYREDILSMVARSDERIVQSFLPSPEKGVNSKMDLASATPEQIRNLRTAGKLALSSKKSQSISARGYNPSIAMRNATKPGGYLYTGNNQKMEDNDSRKKSTQPVVTKDEKNVRKEEAEPRSNGHSRSSSRSKEKKSSKHHGRKRRHHSPPEVVVKEDTKKVVTKAPGSDLEEGEVTDEEEEEKPNVKPRLERRSSNSMAAGATGTLADLLKMKRG